DQLVVTGSATLAGALNVSLIGGFTPGNNDVFAILNYGSHSGTFSSVSGPFSATYNSTNVSISVGGGGGPVCTPPPAGMVSWYPGDGNANDIQGSNNGTLQNGTTFAPGMVSQAFSLDGIDDYVDLGPGFNLNALTLDAWVFIDPTTNTGERRVISKDNFNLSGSRKLFALKSSAGSID